MKICILVMALFFSIAGHANVIGIDAQNFNTTTSGLDFVTVQSSETLEPGIMNLGLFFNYAINTLPNYQNISTQSLDSPRDELVGMDFNIGLGLMKDWDVGLSFPQVIYQNIDENSTAFRGLFESTGMTEIRLNTKYRFFGDSKGGLAAIATVNWYLIENFPFTGTNPGPTYNLELAGDFTWGKINLGANIGYRFRNPGDPVPGVPVEPYPDEFIFSVAGSYLISSIDTKFITEVYNSIPVENVNFTSDRELSSSEFLMGLKYDINTALAIHGGAGAELYHGSASPDLRIYTGINYAFGPLFGKQYEEHSQANPTVAFIDEVNFNQTPPKSETFIAKDVLFEFDSSNINQDFYPILSDLANYLLKGGGFKSLTIVGHTDSVGSLTYNDKLSLRRSTAVRDYIANILPASEKGKVRAEGRGEREPIADNGNFQGRALNRRVEFKILR